MKGKRRFEKKFCLILLSLFLSSFLISFVSAYSSSFYNPRQGMEDLINIVVDFSEPLLQVLLGGDIGSWTGYLLFERLILFIVLITLVYFSLSKVRLFEENKPVLWILSIGVPLLGIRFISFEWLNTILIQYQVLAIALTAGLPFIIFFLFLHNALAEYATLRKIGWIFFGVIFLGLWATSSEYTYSQIYFWTAILAFFFLLFDGTIRRTMLKHKMEDLGFTQKEQFETEIRRQIYQADQDLAHTIISPEQHKKIRRRLEKQLKALYKN